MPVFIFPSNGEIKRHSAGLVHKYLFFVEIHLTMTVYQCQHFGYWSASLNN